MVPSRSVSMVYASDEAAAAPDETEAPAPAKAAKPVKVKAKGNGHAKGAVKAKAKATAAPVKAAKATPAKAKGKAKAERQRDPLKLDAFGFRKGSIKSKAAAMYAKGATLADVKEALGSVQFNLLTELEGRGFTVDKAEIKGANDRMVTRYKIHAPVAA